MQEIVRYRNEEFLPRTVIDAIHDGGGIGFDVDAQLWPYVGIFIVCDLCILYSTLCLSSCPCHGCLHDFLPVWFVCSLLYEYMLSVCSPFGDMPTCSSNVFLPVRQSASLLGSACPSRLSSLPGLLSACLSESPSIWLSVFMSVSLSAEKVIFSHLGVFSGLKI